MYYGNIKKYDIADGPGVRVSLFVSGCRHHCKGCFNAETWNFSYGNPYTEETEAEILEALKPGYIAGLTVLGGEPFEPENQPVVTELLKKVRSKYPGKDIWCYTGYTWDVDLTEGGRVYTEVTEEMLSYIDVLVDGEFVEAKKDITLVFRGSSNQRILNLKAMRKVTLRLAKPEEGAELAKIEAACFPPAEAASEEMVKERLKTFPENFLVAEKNGVLAGFINGGNTDRQYLPDVMYHDVSLHLPDGAYQTVFGLNVLEEYRKEGIASRLVRGYIRLAREHGKKGIILTCKDHMVHYYEKFGFRCYGEADSTHGGARWNDMRLIF